MDEQARQLVDLLSEAGQLEYRAIVHYSHYAQQIEVPELAQELRAIGQMEVRHSHQLMGVILDLGGLPEWQMPPPPSFASVKDIVKSSLEGERRAILQYDRCLEIAQDAALRQTLEQIRLEEETHIERLTRLLADLSQAG